MLMAPEWIYLLKVNVGIALFYAFYKLFCCKDTFFQWRRMALLSFLVISFVYPLLNIQNCVQEQPKMNELVDYYATWLATEDVMVTNEVTTLPTPDLMTLFGYLYMLGMGVFFLRFLIQLLSIFRLVWKGTKTEVDGVKVISLDENVNPFSFFGWIFLYLPELREDSRQEILTHELTHVRQRHSLDVIVSELVTIVCWMNPFIWLLKAEIRLNLEYLADNKVAESLCNTKQYQYHLLGLANQNRQTGLYNHFNVSHLKNRIIMMNKKRTRTTGRIKYALFAPLATALLLVSNIETVARTTERIAKDVVNNLTDTEVKVETDAIEQEGPVFQVVEEMPQFPGGMQEALNFLGTHVRYPVAAQEAKIEGRVIVGFVVGKDGSVSDIKVVRGINPELDAEAVRVVSMMPKWIPGKQRGKAVAVKYTMPIMFRLQNPKPEKEETASLEQINLKVDKDASQKDVEAVKSYLRDGYEELQMNLNDESVEQLPSGGVRYKNKSSVTMHVEDGKYPLIIIDGKEVGRGTDLLKNVPVDQIESISVMKNEAAIAQYGDKANDGVISIATKKNKK